MNIDPRAITDAEQPFLDQLDSFEAMARLQRRIIDAGYSWAMASGTCTHLMALKADDPELLPNTVSRARYRKVLRELIELDRPKGRRRRKADAGYVDVGTLTTVAAGAVGAVVALAHPELVPALLDITRSGGDGEQSRVALAA